jgi:hypothetical protein
MASLILRPHIWPGTVLLIAILAQEQCAMATDTSLLGEPHWRPSAIPAIASTNSPVNPQAIKTALAYAEGDEDKVLALALRLPKDEATSALCQYIDQYEMNNPLTGQAWGRTVYCLGLVQTEQARKALYKMWERYDQRLQRQHELLKIDDMSRSVPPLRAIGDALHWYLSHEGTRTWFLDRIAEAERMPMIADHRASAYWRKEDRIQLLLHLYRWDLIDSIEGQSPLSGDRILALHPFSPAHVDRVQLSADRLVSYMNNLAPLHLDATEAQWMELRSSPREYMLDSTASLLGLPLATAVWDKYLHHAGTALDDGVRYRLWMTTLWTCFKALRGTEIGKWMPNADQRALLADALTYTENLPPGHLRRLATEALWGIACFVEEQHAPSEVLAIRTFAIAKLDSSLRARTLRLIQNASTLTRDGSSRTDAVRPANKNVE